MFKKCGIQFHFCTFKLLFLQGRQCQNQINDVVSKWKFFNKVVVEKFLTPEGKLIYDGCLSLCSKKFPLYVDELKGMAEGAGVPFYKVLKTLKCLKSFVYKKQVHVFMHLHIAIPPTY